MSMIFVDKNELAMAAILCAVMIVGVVRPYRGLSDIMWVDHNGLIDGWPVVHPGGSLRAIPYMRGGELYILTDNGSVFVYYNRGNIYKIIDGSRVMIDPKDFDVGYISIHRTKKIDEDTIFYAVDCYSLPYMVTFTGDSCKCVALSKVRREYWHDGNRLFAVSQIVNCCRFYSQGHNTVEFDLGMPYCALDIRHGMLLCTKTNASHNGLLFVIDIQTRQTIWKYMWYTTRNESVRNANFASDNVIIADVYDRSGIRYLCANMIDNTVCCLCDEA